MALCFIISCDKPETENIETLKFLYKEYKHGSINKAIFNNKIVFTASLDMWDAPTIIYSNEGVYLGICDYAWGPVDPICDKLTNFEEIYRCENHSTGLPPVDKYNLSNL
jgi:hypothetical protein